MIAEIDSRRVGFSYKFQNIFQIKTPDIRNLASFDERLDIWKSKANKNGNYGRYNNKQRILHVGLLYTLDHLISNYSGRTPNVK